MWEWLKELLGVGTPPDFEVTSEDADAARATQKGLHEAGANAKIKTTKKDVDT